VGTKERESIDKIRDGGGGSERRYDNTSSGMRSWWSPARGEKVSVHTGGTVRDIWSHRHIVIKVSKEKK
jgi:hypothetical protein